MKITSVSINLSGFLILAAVCCMLFTACTQQQTLKEQISDLEGQYKAATEDNNVSIRSSEVTNIMKELATAYEAYAEKEASPEEAPQYFYNAAELFETNMVDPNKALAIFDKIIQKYPEHERAADALFRKGYIYHNMLNDLPAAKKTYQAFVDKYPGHQLRESAIFEINNLGKSPEQILNEIQQKNKTDSLSPSSPPS